MAFPLREPLIGLWDAPHAGDPKEAATFAGGRGIDLGALGPRRQQNRGQAGQLQKQKDEDVGVGVRVGDTEQLEAMLYQFEIASRFCRLDREPFGIDLALM